LLFLKKLFRIIRTCRFCGNTYHKKDLSYLKADQPQFKRYTNALGKSQLNVIYAIHECCNDCHLKWKENENSKFSINLNVPHLPLNKGDEVLYKGTRYGFSKYATHDIVVIHHLDGSSISLPESIVMINELIKVDKSPGEPLLKVFTNGNQFMIQYKEEIPYTYHDLPKMTSALSTLVQLYNGAPVVCEDKHLRLKLVTSGFVIQNKSS